MSRFTSFFKPKRLSKQVAETIAPPTRAPIDVPLPLRRYFEASTYIPVYLSDDVLHPVVKMVQLTCEDGPGQVVFREDSLLDLDLLQRHSGKRFHRMDRSQYRQVLGEVGVNLIPPMPRLTCACTWVDYRVDDLDSALVDLTGQREYAVVSKVMLMDWLKDNPRVDIAMSMLQLNSDDGSIQNDTDCINGAIRKLTKLRIERRLVDTLELPPLPDIARRLIELRSNPQGNLMDLVEAIESDPILSANVLRWANSSLYATTVKVESVTDAVGRVLGYDMTMNLMMGLVLGRVMDVPDHTPTHVLGFWEQSIWVAHGARAVSKLLPSDRHVPHGLAYLTGLLHNFGYLILNHAFPPHFRLITESTDINRHIDVSLVDAHILGITREQIGAELLRNWMIGEDVVTGVRYHKRIEYTHEATYANLIYLTRGVLMKHGVLLGARYTVPLALYTYLGLSPEAVDDCIVALLEHKDEILGMAHRV